MPPQASASTSLPLSTACVRSRRCSSTVCGTPPVCVSRCCVSVAVCCCPPLPFCACYNPSLSHIILSPLSLNPHSHSALDRMLHLACCVAVKLSSSYIPVYHARLCLFLSCSLFMYVLINSKWMEWMESRIAVHSRRLYVHPSEPTIIYSYLGLCAISITLCALPSNGERHRLDPDL